MDTYKFRAKEKYGTQSGKWQFGYFVKDYNNTSYITTLDGVDTFIVDENTLGQLTPFKDQKGTDVYIGDIVQDIIVGLKSEVVFTDYGNIGLRPLNNEVKDLEYQTIDPSWLCTSAEIIGNIHT